MSTNDQRCVKRGVSSTHCGNNRDLKVQTSAHACEKPFRCGMCLKCFSCKTKVKHHIRIHSGEGPHQCEVCKKCLHPSSGLKKHMSVHAGVKNFTSQYMLRSGKQKASKTLAATEALPLARRKTKKHTPAVQSTSFPSSSASTIDSQSPPAAPSSSGSPAESWSPSVKVSAEELVNPVGNAICSSYQSSAPGLQSPAVDIALHVPQNVKEKIFRGEFIDLGHMLNTMPESSDIKYKLVLSQGKLVMQPIQQQWNIRTIEIWTDAFIVYMAIFCSVHTSRIQELLKYMQTVRLGADRCSGTDWKTYDEQYRLRKAMNPASSWGVIDSELWLMYIYSPTVPLTPGRSGLTARPTAKKCYAFNYDGFCNNSACIYQHTCIRCSLGHPIKSCQRQNAQSSSSLGGNRFRNLNTNVRKFRSNTYNF